MKKVSYKKLLVSILIAVILVTLGFIVLFIVSFSGALPFYRYLVIAVTFILIIFAIFKIFEFIPLKLLNKIMVSCFIIIILLVTGYQIREYHRQSIPTVGEQGVDLNLYRPFVEGTKAVSLNEEASLKFETDLPIIDGATALYPVYSAFAQALYPEADYNVVDSEVICTTTTAAYQNLIDAKVDLIFVAGPSEAQLEEAASKGVELEFTPIGAEAFVFYVNGRNAIDSLSSQEIQGIYTGEITNWQEVGGKNQSIRAFQRPEGSGSQTTLEAFMGEKELMNPPTEDIVAGMGDIIERTADYRNYEDAIGYSFLYFATEMLQNDKIKLLAVDGVYPKAEAIRTKEYPLTGEFYAVTAGSDNPNLEAFIDWILSEQGQRIIEKTGYIPLN